MVTLHSNSKKDDRSISFMLLSSAFITVFLFFIDEGFYNFNWMSDLGNWVAFAIYLSLIFGCQYGIYQIFKRIKPTQSKLGWSIAIGTTVALLLAFLVIFN